MEKRDKELARRFLEVVPPLLHSLGNVFREMKEVVEPVTIQQVRTMIALRHCQRSLGELAEMHEVSAPAVSRLVSILVERGWVLREIDPRDRRQVVLTLSATGGEVLDSISERSAEYLAQMLQRLDNTERVALETTLEALCRVVRIRRAGAGTCEAPNRPAASRQSDEEAI